MGRFVEAITLPFIVFPAAAVIAIAVGVLLHQFPRTVAPFAALAMTILVTAAGFLLLASGERLTPASQA